VDKAKAVDKVWPPARGYGVLALPYQKRYAIQNRGTLAVDVENWSLIRKSEQLDAVLECEELDQDEVASFLEFVGIADERAAKMLSGTPLRMLDRGVAVKDGTDTGLTHMVQYCEAVKRFEEEATELSYEFWFGMMTNFKPFAGGKELFEKFSQLDPGRWKQRPFDAMWRGIKGGPRLCCNLEQGWVCPQRDVCEARSPAGLPFWLRRKGLTGDKVQ
jgi:hypothetical protein